MQRLSDLLLRREFPPVAINVGQVSIRITRNREFHALKLHLCQWKDVLLIECALVETCSQAYTILVLRIVYASYKSGKRYEQTEIDDLHHLVEEMSQLRIPDVLGRLDHIEIEELGHVRSEAVRLFNIEHVQSYALIFEIL